MKKALNYDFHSLTSDKEVSHFAYQVITAANAGQKDSLWTSAAKDMLVMIILYLKRTNAERQNFDEVITLLHSVRCAEDALDTNGKLVSGLIRYAEENDNIFDNLNILWQSCSSIPPKMVCSITETLLNFLE